MVAPQKFFRGPQVEKPCRTRNSSSILYIQYLMCFLWHNKLLTKKKYDFISIVKKCRNFFSKFSTNQNFWGCAYTRVEKNPWVFLLFFLKKNFFGFFKKKQDFVLFLRKTEKLHCKLFLFYYAISPFQELHNNNLLYLLWHSKLWVKTCTPSLF